MIDLTHLFTAPLVPDHIQAAAKLIQSGKNVILAMPPRSGKTSLMVAYAKSEKYQGKKVLYITYGSQIADRMGGYCGCNAVGLGALSSQIGKGYDLVLVDDILKGHQEAHDEKHVKMAVTWFDSIIMSSACKPETQTIIIGSRWHKNDFIGNNEAGLFLNHAIPAISRDQVGSESSYWPEEYPLERLNEIRKTISGEDFKWIYQQGMA